MGHCRRPTPASWDGVDEPMRPISNCMIDRILYSTLNLTVMTAIALMTAAALICAHSGVLSLLSGATSPGGTLLAIAAVLAVAATFMIRHRNDLADR